MGKTKKTSLIAILICLLVMSTLLSFLVANLNNAEVADAAAVGTATITYKTYDYVAYVEYLEAVKFADAYLMYVGLSGDTGWQAGYTKASQKVLNIYVDGVSAYSYFGNKMPYELTQYSDLMDLIDADQEGDELIEEGKDAVTPPTQKTSFVPGEYICIEIYGSGSNTITAMQYTVDLAGLGITDATAISDSSCIDDDTLVTYAFNEEIFETSDGDETYFDLDGSHAEVTEEGYFSISASTNDPDAGIYGEFKLGYLACKVKTGAPANINIAATGINKTSPTASDYTYMNDPDLNCPSITETSLAIAVDGGALATASLSNVKVNSTNISISGTTTIDGNALDTFPSAALSTSTSSVALYIVPDNSGTVTTIRYCVSSSVPTSSSAFTGTGTSTSSYDYAYTPASWNAGETIYALATICSADTTDTKQYIIAVPKAKYTIAELTGLSIVGNGSVYDLYNAGNTATTSFVSGTTNYTLRVSKDNSTLTFTPTVDTTKFETIKIGGSTVTSGSSSNVSVSTSTSSVAILVTAQDGITTNIYTISLYWLKDDTSLASVSITVDSYITNNATYNSSTSTYSLSGSTAVPFGSSIFTFAPTITSGANSTIEYSLTNSFPGTTISSGASAPASGISFGSGSAEVTKNAYLKVTAEDGITTKVYTIAVTRYGGDTDSTLNSSNPASYRISTGSATSGTGNALTFTMTGTNTYTATVNGIAFAQKTFAAKVTTTQSTSSISYTCTGVSSPVSATVTSSGAWINDISFGTSKAAVAATITFTVTAQDANYQSTYIIILNRLAASQDTTASISLYTGSGLVLTTGITGDYTHSSNLAYTTSGLKVQADFDSLATASATDSTSTFNLSDNVLSSEFTYTGTAQVEKTIVITVTAEDTSYSKTYTIKVTRDAADDDNSYTITITNSSSTALSSTLDTTTVGYRIHTVDSTLAFTESYININIALNSLYSTITYGGSPVSGTNQYQLTASFTAMAVNAIFDFTVTTQKGTVVIVRVAVSRAAANNDRSIASYQVSGNSSGNAYGATENTSTNTYTVDNYPKSIEGSTYYLTVTANASTTKVYTSTTAPTSYNDSCMTLYTPYTAYAVDTILYVTLVAESHGYTVYTFNVKAKDERDTHYEIDNIELTGLDSTTSFTYSATTYSYGTFNVPYATKTIGYTITMRSEKASLSKAGINGSVSTGSAGSTKKITGTATLSAGINNTLIFQGMAENNTVSSDYTITIFRSNGNTDNYITSLTINSASVSVSSNTIDYVVLRALSSAQIDYAVSTNAEYEMTDIDTSSSYSVLSYSKSLSLNKANTVTIKVRSEKDKVDGNATYNVYTLRIYRAEQTYGVSDIELFKDAAGTSAMTITDTDTSAAYTFNASKTTYNLSVAYSAASGVLISPVLDTNSQNATVTGNTSYASLTASNSTPNVFTITITSEYQGLNSSITNQTVTYTFNITRVEASTTKTLSDLYLIIGGVAQPTLTDFVPNDATRTTYQAGELTAATVALGYTLTDPDHSYVDATSTTSTTLTTTNTTETLTIKVVDELGNALVYSVKVSTDRLVLDEDNSIISININKDGSTNLITYVATTKSYSFTLRYPVTQVNVSAVLGSSLATLTMQKDSSSAEQVASGAIKTFSINQGATTVIKITAKAESTAIADNEYTITITSQAADTDKSLKTFTIDGTTVTNGATINILNGQGYVALVAETRSTYAVISPANTGSTTKYNVSNYPVSVGSNIISFIVTDENGDSLPYSITVERDELTTLSDLNAYDVLDTSKVTNLVESFSTGTTSYSKTVSYDVESVDIGYVLDATDISKVTVTGAGVRNLTAGVVNQLDVTIKAKSGHTSTYTLYITREAGNDNNYITSYVQEDGVNYTGDLSTTASTITYALARTYIGQTFNPIYTISSDATSVIKETNLSLNLGFNQFNIEVTSQTKRVKNYIINVYVCDTEKEITMIALKDSTTMATFVDDNSNSLSFSQTTYQYGTFNVSYSVSSIYLEVTANTTATIYLNGTQFTNSNVPLSAGTNTLEIYAKSEYATYNTAATGTESAKYKIIIEKDTPNSDGSLLELSVRIDSVEKIVSFDPSVKTYTITNVGDVSSAVIYARSKFAAPKAIITIGSSVSASGTDNVTYTKQLPARSLDASGNAINATFEQTITVKPESGAEVVYTVIIARESVNLSEDNRLSYIEVIDSNNNIYLTNGTFNASTLAYTINIPFGPQSYTIRAVTYQGFPGTTSGDGQYAIVFTNSAYLDASGNYQRSHQVYATSASGADGTMYTVTIKVASPSKDCTLADLIINYNSIDGFSPTTYNYTIATVANAVDQIHISAIPTEPHATLSGDLGYVSLNEGNNTFVVTVTAQSGATQNYQIYIKRQYATPYLVDLEVIGEQLLDVATEKATPFNKNTNSYSVIVKYVTDKISIDAIVDEESYIVSCSNSTVNSASGTVRAFAANLAVGTNSFTISVRSTHGLTTTYTLNVQRRDVDSANTNIADITVSTVETKEVLLDNSGYSNLQFTYEYVVPNKVRNLDLDITVEKISDASGNGAKYQIFNDKNLSVGNNQVIVLVTAEDEQTTRAVIINVLREENKFDVAIKEIDSFEEDFAKDTIQEKYTVASNVSKLQFSVTNRDKTNIEQPTFAVINGENLKVGDNEVKLIITAPDGTQEAQTIIVTRSAMKFTVDKNAYSYSCQEVSGAVNNYTINLGNKKVDAIEDYTKYVVPGEGEELTVTELSRSNGEVVLMVANSDESEVQYVHLAIQTTANNGSMFDILFWIGLGIAIILLVIILICVNKDKYGSISKNRKA